MLSLEGKEKRKETQAPPVAPVTSEVSKRRALQPGTTWCCCHSHVNTPTLLLPLPLPNALGSTHTGLITIISKDPGARRSLFTTSLVG